MPVTPAERAILLADVEALAREAGNILMDFYHRDYGKESKADNSPVTEADIAADQHIVAGLDRLTPHIPVISEEGVCTTDCHMERFWLVDPLDGTKSFIRKKGAFTVNIGLIEGGKPTLGAVYVPTERVMYAGDVHVGAFREDESGRAPIHTRVPPVEGVDAVVSLMHAGDETEAFLAGIPVRSRVSASSSIKFCILAEGKADCYPRFGRTMEWDTAAGHAVLAAAGGRVVTPGGDPFGYGKPDFANGYFIAWGK